MSIKLSAMLTNLWAVDRKRPHCLKFTLQHCWQQARLILAYMLFQGRIKVGNVKLKVALYGY